MCTQLLEMLDAVVHPLVQIIRCVSPRRTAWKFDQVYTWCLQIRLIVPRPLLIEGVQILTGEAYRTGGGTSDIYLGRFGGSTVAVKVPRVTQVKRIEVMQDIINEVMVMASIGYHRHIIDILGVSLDRKTGIPWIVTPWMDYGTLADVIRLEPTQEYRQIMVEHIVDGMSFLKISNVVHGDLKCSNILIARDGRACIADFGLAHFSEDLPSDSSSVVSDLSAFNLARVAISRILPCNISGFLDSKTSLGAGSPRWMAPERLWPDRWGLSSATATFESDVFSLGMIIYEIYSAKLPFFSYNDPMAMFLIVEGNRPRRPRLITDRLWNLAERCWDATPAARPFIEMILREINQEENHDLVQ